jgi:GT2 family glycosyltransferase
MTPRVYVILVNWNGWRHTLECLESLFRQDYHPFVAVVCDNASEDGSWERLKAWAQGKLPFPGPHNPALGHLFRTPLAKPLPFLCYDREAAAAGGRAEKQAPLIFIQTGANLGFGGGNNVGLRYVLAQGDAAYVWLLNNDTVVEPDALDRVVARGEAEPQVGAVGSLLLDYHRPERISSLCGKRLRPWLGVVHSPFLGQPRAVAPAVPPPVDYLEGAACLLPVSVLRRVGLFDPDYFHFWEDVDLCRRIVRRGYRLVCEPASRVYHKEKVSMAGHSPRADYYEFYSGVIYYRKHFSPARVLGVTLVKLTLKVLNRLRRRQWDRIPLLVRAFWDAFRYPLGVL